MNPPRDELDHPVNILLVDDRPSNLSALEAILRRPDYNLLLARSGPEALAIILRQELAVILLDIAMPGMDGFEIANMIKDRERSQWIPIIFITASVYEMDSIFRSYTVGPIDYLRKPIDPYQVRARVAIFVELYRQRRQIEDQANRLRELEFRSQWLLRTRAEQGLLESDKLYQLTFEQAPIGIGHATPEGLWARANLRLGEILGCSRDALIGQNVTRIAEENDGKDLADALSRLATGASSMYAGEHRLSTTRAAELWGCVTISPLRDSSDRVAYLIVVIEDITARRQADLQRAELIRTLERSIASMNREPTFREPRTQLP